MYIIILFFIDVILFDIVCKNIYCLLKKKRKNYKKCFYWSCKNWHICPYNGGKNVNCNTENYLAAAISDIS